MTYGYIYVIRNKVNGKLYVGQTTNTVPKRFDQHKRFAKGDKCHGMPLLNAMRKYGVEQFEIIDQWSCESSDEMNFLEREKIEALGTRKNGYNILEGGSNWGEADRQRMSAKMKEVYADPQLRADLSERTKKQMSSPEVRARLSEQTTELWKDSNFREKTSKAIKESQARPEVKEKMRKSQQIACNTPEAKKRISEQSRRIWADSAKRKQASERQKVIYEDVFLRAEISDTSKKQWADLKTRETIYNSIKKAATDKLKGRWGSEKTEIILPCGESKIMMMYELSDFCREKGLVYGNALKAYRGEISHTKQYRFRRINDGSN